ncbi:MAG: LicD family protein [Oscillospiraceae bacterium]|jgi:lipopolysaccharide cholinephosphotransferase|nr:LicD family protein [Oscillospiraceae bacterium]
MKKKPQPQLVELTDAKLRELQIKNLQMYEFFADFCTQNGLRFFVCGGCLIGAVRYGGFLPWDDDIDVIMPREDYKKLMAMGAKIAKSNRFVLQNPDVTTPYNGNVFATMVDTKYKLVKQNQAHLQNLPCGLVMDIFPLDKVPQNPKADKIQKIWTLVYMLFRAQVVPEKHGGIKAFGSKFLLGLFFAKKLRKKIWQFAEKKMQKHNHTTAPYIADLCSGPITMKINYPKEIFADVTTLDFENTKIQTMAKYHDYLTIAFGKDYITPPPKEKQICHHDLTLLDLSE